MKRFSTHVRLILFLCSISLLALLAYRVPHLTAWQAEARVPATGTQLQILIPLYSYPNHYDPDNYIWDDVAAANSQVPITAIINPNSGPGGLPNDDYKIGLGHLRDAGVTIVGYVPTDYGNRPPSDVEADVDLYNHQDFDIDGIFFDEVATDELSDYQDLYDYVKARPNLDKVIINPGVNVSEGYISAPASDTAIIFENYSTEWPSYQPSAYMANYSADRFAMLAHGASQATMQSDIDRAKACNIGYVYLTDDTLENNPWDSLPSFWSEEVAYIQQINSTPNPSATCTPTSTPTSTPSATPIPTNTPTSTPSATRTPTNTPTSTNTPPVANTPTFTPTPFSEVEPQILIPLYSYPNWYDENNYIWDDVAAANSQVPITAIINPNSGPGGSAPNADYVTGLNHLRDAGVTIVGYVPTNYGDRPATDVKADVDLYDQHFNIDGIFFDEAATNKLSYYQDLYAYVKAQPNLDKVIINPGVNVSEGYISTEAPASDTAIIFENYSTQWPSYQPSAYMAHYSADRFAMLAHGVPDLATMQSHIDLAKERNIGYVYLTDDTLENNPWDSLPTFWQEELDYIAMSPTPTPTPTSTMGPTGTPDKSGPTPTNTPSPSATPTASATSTPTNTASPSATPAKNIPTPTNSATPSATPSAIPENALYLPLVIR